MKKIVVLVIGAFMAMALGGFAAEQPPLGTLAGQILLKSGEPLSRGKASFFREGAGPPPSQSRYWRTPDQVTDLDEQGRFTIQLPPGRYFIAAMKKQNRDMIGPPTEGDLVFPERDLHAEQQSHTYVVVSGQTNNLGALAGAAPFHEPAAEHAVKVTAIEGTFTDSAGKPVAGAIAVAFPTPNLTGKPLFVSKRTGADGKFSLKVSGAGTYYVKLRTALKGGLPEQGELIGFYGKQKPSPVVVKVGETLTGMNVVGRAYVMPGKGSPGERKPGGPPEGRYRIQ